MAHDARGRGAALIATAEGEVLAQIAKVRAEIKRQQARAIQVQRRLEADVVQPADAARLKMEEDAAGDAATIVERGKAEAMALRSLVDSYRKGGAAAKEVLALQSVLPLVQKICGAEHALTIGKVTVLPHDDHDDQSLTRKLIGANEQIKAAAGLDLAAMAGRIGGKS